MFSLRIVTVDYYLSVPVKDFDTTFSDFRGAEIYKVPVIRVFGVTPAGQKGCLHVHGVFPYLSVPYDDDLPVDPKSSIYRKYSQELAYNIDKALNIASRKSNSNRHHVYKIILEPRIPFYGYHEKEQPFLKIFFYNPIDIKRTMELLSTGLIMNKVIQPFEAHIPYTLQFFIDYNLFGMNLINVELLKFRMQSETGESCTVHPKSQFIGQSCEKSFFSKIWDFNALKSSEMASDIKKQTSCELEADCCATYILNHKDAKAKQGENPGLCEIWEEERQRRRDRSDSSQITLAVSQERSQIVPTKSDTLYRGRLKQILSESNIKSNESTSNMKDGESTSLHKEEMNSSLSQDSMPYTQDKDMLSMVLSIMNNESYQCDEEEDSILSCRMQEPGEDDGETLEMSSIIMDDDELARECGFPVSASSNVMIHNENDKSSPLTQSSQELKNPNFSSPVSGSKEEEYFKISQLDGTDDSDDFLMPKFQKSRKARTLQLATTTKQENLQTFSITTNNLKKSENEETDKKCSPLECGTSYKAMGHSYSQRSVPDSFDEGKKIMHLKKTGRKTTDSFSDPHTNEQRSVAVSPPKKGSDSQKPSSRLRRRNKYLPITGLTLSPSKNNSSSSKIRGSPPKNKSNSSKNNSSPPKNNSREKVENILFDACKEQSSETSYSNSFGMLLSSYRRDTPAVDSKRNAKLCSTSSNNCMLPDTVKVSQTNESNDFGKRNSTKSVKCDKLLLESHKSRTLKGSVKKAVKKNSPFIFQKGNIPSNIIIPFYAKQFDLSKIGCEKVILKKVALNRTVLTSHETVICSNPESNDPGISGVCKKGHPTSRFCTRSKKNHTSENRNDSNFRKHLQKYNGDDGLHRTLNLKMDKQLNSRKTFLASYEEQNPDVLKARNKGSRLALKRKRIKQVKCSVLETDRCDGPRSSTGNSDNRQQSFEGVVAVNKEVLNPTECESFSDKTCPASMGKAQVSQPPHITTDIQTGKRITNESEQLESLSLNFSSKSGMVYNKINQSLAVKLANSVLSKEEEHEDVLYKLAFLSPSASYSDPSISPPCCWSPNSSVPESLEEGEECGKQPLSSVQDGKCENLHKGKISGSSSLVSTSSSSLLNSNVSDPVTACGFCVDDSELHERCSFNDCSHCNKLDSHITESGVIRNHSELVLHSDKQYSVRNFTDYLPCVHDAVMPHVGLHETFIHRSRLKKGCMTEVVPENLAFFSGTKEIRNSLYRDFGSQNILYIESMPKIIRENCGSSQSLVNFVQSDVYVPNCVLYDVQKVLDRLIISVDKIVNKKAYQTVSEVAKDYENVPKTVCNPVSDFSLHNRIEDGHYVDSVHKNYFTGANGTGTTCKLKSKKCDFSENRNISPSADQATYESESAVKETNTTISHEKRIELFPLITNHPVEKLAKNNSFDKDHLEHTLTNEDWDEAQLKSFYNYESLTLQNSSDWNDSKLSTTSHSTGTHAVVKKSIVLQPKCKPPTRKEVENSCELYDIPETRHQEAFFSNPLDVAGGKPLMDHIPRAKSTKISELLDFDTKFQIGRMNVPSVNLVAFPNMNSSNPSSSFHLLDVVRENPEMKVTLAGNGLVVLTPASFPPSRKAVEEWVKFRCTKMLPEQEDFKTSGTVKEGNCMESEECLDSISSRTKTSAGENTKVNSEIVSCVSDSSLKVNCHQEEISPIFPVKTELNLTPNRSLVECRNFQKYLHSVSTPLSQVRFKNFCQQKPSVSLQNCQTLKSCDNTNNNNSLCESLSVATSKDNSPLSPVLFTKDSTVQSLKRKRKLFGNNELEGMRLSPKECVKLDRSVCGGKMSSKTDDTFTEQNNSSCSQIEGPTYENTGNYKVNLGNLGDARSVHMNQFLTVMSVEIHVNTRNDLRPDPEHDAVCAVFYYIYNDVAHGHYLRQEVLGVIVLDDSGSESHPENTAAAPPNIEASITSDNHQGTVPSDSQLNCNNQSEPVGNVGLQNDTSVSSNTSFLKSSFVSKLKTELVVKTGIGNVSVKSVQDEKTLFKELSTTVERIPKVKESSYFAIGYNHKARKFANIFHYNE